MAKRKSMLERNHDPVKDGMARRTKPGERAKQSSTKEELMDRRVQMFMTESMYQQLREEAFKREISYATIIREAIEAHLG